MMICPSRDDLPIVFVAVDYLKELTPPGSIYGLSSIDRAMTVCYNQTRDWCACYCG